jgi:hypothetical protein
MKDSEFIELLNLYLDHEITATDAARLEAEVQHNPARRRVYQQYCRMQKACTMLAKDFVADESVSGAEGQARKVVAFEQRRDSWSPGLFAVGGLVAAAACVAVIFVNRPVASAPEPVGASPLAAAQPSATPVIAPVETKVMVAQLENSTGHASISRTVTVPVSSRNDLQPVLVARSLSLGGQFAAVGSAVATDAAPQLDWISGLQIAPLPRVQAEELRFDARPADVTKQPAYGNRVRPVQQGIVEMTAFRFEK